MEHIGDIVNIKELEGYILNKINADIRKYSNSHNKYDYESGNSLDNIVKYKKCVKRIFEYFDSGINDIAIY